MIPRINSSLWSSFEFIAVILGVADSALIVNLQPAILNHLVDEALHLLSLRELILQTRDLILELLMLLLLVLGKIAGLSSQ